MQRCTPRPNAACGFGNRSSTISSGLGERRRDRGCTSRTTGTCGRPRRTANPATSQSCVIVRPPPCAGREVPQELLGGGVHVVGVVDQAHALVGPRVEPLERAGEQRRRGVEPTSDEQRDGADDAVVGEELAHHLGVEQRGDHARDAVRSCGSARIRRAARPWKWSSRSCGPSWGCPVPCTPACARARSRSPSRRAADRASPW